MASPRVDSQEQYSVAFGGLLRQLRSEQDLSLKALGKLVPMSDSNLSRIERGKQGPPSEEVIERLAELLKSDPAELLRAAGRAAGESSFEQFVRATLTAMRQDLEQIKAAVGR